MAMTSSTTSGKNHYFSKILETIRNTMQKTVCQYLVSVLRNLWQKLYQIKENRPKWTGLIKMSKSLSNGQSWSVHFHKSATMSTLKEKHWESLQNKTNQKIITLQIYYLPWVHFFVAFFFHCPSAVIITLFYYLYKIQAKKCIFSAIKLVKMAIFLL